ncbi:MAG: 23S rRNA (guanosine(2251)-2'-O)-methyltransferase RlmB [candidate division KSB1 bacterium]|nr:23S rRNA (guanosine(2251)-2'-O)-methyltransferase RlmB [candidate division KSB1 bacterium]MDZ7411541.1 23S rRNA (guanosine(2251)-2'-O)-methyltransferase RlmB [candidate division KSB1 bacterium]
MIFGRNPLAEALAAQIPVRKIVLAQGIGSAEIEALLQQARARKIPVQLLPRPELDRLAKTNKHQGVVGWLAAVEYTSCETMLANVERRTPREKPALLLLDGVEDPRNLGAIIRVAEAAGMHGLVITKKRCADVTAVTIKTSAGAAFHLPIAQVANLASQIEALKKRGLWIVGLDERGEQTVFEMDANLPLAIVVGGEGRGLHRLVREKCDFVYCIPMRGRVASLNVATAAAVACYEIVRQRRSLNHSVNPPPNAPAGS